jgi:hypothetical protein
VVGARSNGPRTPYQDRRFGPRRPDQDRLYGPRRPEQDRPTARRPRGHPTGTPASRYSAACRSRARSAQRRRS